jgi:hypothetical protein
MVHPEIRALLQSAGRLIDGLAFDRFYVLGNAVPALVVACQSLRVALDVPSLAGNTPEEPTSIRLGLLVLSAEVDALQRNGWTLSDDSLQRRSMMALAAGFDLLDRLEQLDSHQLAG